MSEMFPQRWLKLPLLNIVQSVQTGVTEFVGEKAYFSTGSIKDYEYTAEGLFNFKNRPSRANRIGVLNDVLQARMKETNKGLIVDESLNGSLFSTGFLQLRPYGNTVDSRFLYYYVVSPTFLNQKNELATGSTQEALTDFGAEKLIFPLPPLNEQKRIAAKLDQIMPRINAVKNRLEKIPVILKRFRQAVLSAAVTGKLTEKWRVDLINKGFNELAENKNIDGLPATWEIVNIERLIKSIKSDLRTGPFGSSLKKNEHQLHGIPVWGIESIGQNGDFLNINKIFVTQAKAKELKSFSVIGGDIIISRSGTVGELCILPDNIPHSLISTNLLKISLNRTVVLPRFFSYMFKAPDSVINKMKEICSGSTRLFLTQRILRSLQYPLPPLDEQKEIVQHVERLFALADKLEARYKSAKAKVDKLAQLTLAKAFRGQLVTPEAELAQIEGRTYETAEQLLERIIEEKRSLSQRIQSTRRKK
jgi:type I restriction enzyme, S subunit